MRLINLKLRGAIGIKKGMGVDEIEIDFTGLSGLTVLDGDNGRGKTTILDNLHPFRALPSRDRRLANHFFLRDSYRDLTIEMNGHNYRFLIKIDAEKNKQEAFIYVDGSQESQTTGKVREYDAFVNDLFGSYNLFMSSVFCPQGTDDSKLTTSEMKDQFAEFLRLDRLQEYHETAKQAVRIVEQEINRLDVEQSRLFLERSTMEQVETTVETVKEQIKENKEHINDTETEINQLQRELESAIREQAKRSSALEAQAKTQEQIEQAQGEISALKAELANIDKEHNKEIAALEDELQAQRDLLATKSLVDRAKKQKREIREKIRELNINLVSHREKWREIDEKERNKIADIDNIIATIQNTLNGYMADESKVKTSVVELQGQVKKEQDRLTRLTPKNDTEIQKLKSKLLALKSKLIDLDRKDPACKSTTCSFIVGALEAQNQIPEIEQAISERQQWLEAESNVVDETIKELQAQVSNRQAQASKIAESIKNSAEQIERARTEKKDLLSDYANEKNKIQAEANRLKEQVAKAEQEMADLENILLMQAKIEVAEKRIDDLTRQISASMDRKVKQEIDIKGRIAKLVERIESLKKEISDMALPHIPMINVAGIKERIAAAKGRAKLYQKEIEDLQASFVRAQEQVKKRREIDDKMVSVGEKRSLLQQEQSQWQYLADACSKKGIQALEIDAVCPAISGIANKLLANSFGPLFQVRIDTLNENAKETLDIWVVREDGEETLLDNLSGGERVWVLKSLRLARTLIAKEKSGRNLQTCFADEEDGALRHGETSQNFISMYRQFLNLGGFEQCVFISHKPECISMADNRVVLEQGGVSLL